MGLLQNQSNPKILIVRLGAMGDIIHTMPAVALLRAWFGDAATIDWLIEPRWVELLAAGGSDHLATMNITPRNPQKPLVDRIFTADTQRWRKNIFASNTANEYRALQRALQAEEYDAAIDLQGNIKSAWLARMSGMKNIYGSSKPRESLAQLFYTLSFPPQGEHAVHHRQSIAEESACSIAELFNIDPKNLPGLQTAEKVLHFKADPDILPHDSNAEQWCDQQLLRFGITRGNRFAILTPGAGWPAKQWPAQKFGELAYTLAKEGVSCLVNAAPSEVELAEEVVIASQDCARTVSCSIGQLIALCRRAAVFIGGDTGPLHLANALAVPTVALYGPTDPAFNGPYFQPYEVLRSPLSQNISSHKNQHDVGLESITVDEVMTAVRKLLA